MALRFCMLFLMASIAASGSGYASESANLIDDPFFESGSSGFAGDGSSTFAERSTASPLQGESSLNLRISGWGNSIWWCEDYATKSEKLKISARFRSNLESSTKLRFTAMAYYTSGEAEAGFAEISGTAGEKGVVSTELDLDQSRNLEFVCVRLYSEGSAAVDFTMDEASLTLTGAEQAPPPPPSGPVETNNLLSDPTFESGTSNFEGDGENTFASHSYVSPLEGNYSLNLTMNGWGNSVWWCEAREGKADKMKISAQFRSNLESQTKLRFAAWASYKTGDADMSFAEIPGSIGEKGVISTELNVDKSRDLDYICVRLFTEGAGAVNFTMDSASVTLVGAVGPTPVPPVPTEPTREDGEGNNLLADPLFESSTSGFAGDGSVTFAERSTTAPLEGTGSLNLRISGWGNGVWWCQFMSGKAQKLKMHGQFRSNLASSTKLRLGAMAYYKTGETDASFTEMSGTAGDKGIAATQLPLDSDKELDKVCVRLHSEGTPAIDFTMDRGSVTLVGATGGPVSNPDPGGGGGGSDPDPTPTEPSPYQDYTYSFPNGRPYISLEDVSQVNRSGTAFTRLKNWVDSQISQGGGSSATQSVIMFHLTQEVKYINHAIQMVENHVSMAEIEINAGRRPAIANDSYLEIGWYLEQLSIVYDYAFERLTESQRSRWASYAELTLNNLWHPSQAQWGGVPHPWSGWSVTNPGNNYHYSFLRATQFWALAGQNPAWFTFLKSAKFPPLVSYYTHLSGGGSREGTGYGTAQKNLFELLRYWKSSTGEDLADYSTHAKDTIDYWIHATVPTMNRFVPVGDQSRVSQPEIYDYHEHLVQELIQITRGTDQARRGTWWLNHNSLPQMSSGSNFHNDLLPKLDEELAPTDLVYHAQGVGLLFARSSWNTDATWLSLVAGPYDESHAHQEQGSFTFYKNTWLVATSNIWSHSGIQQGVNAHNVVRFEKNNAVIPQNHAVSSMTHSEEGGVMTAVANLSPVYSRRSVDVSSWQRTLRFENNKLRVQDVCEVGVGVTPIFQLHVPVLPTVGADGVILAGNLKIEPQSEVTAQVVEMHAVDSDFNTGWRIELTALTGCGFTVDLTAL